MDPKALEELQYRDFMNRAVPSRATKAQTENIPERIEAKYIRADHPDRERFLQLCEAISLRGFMEWGEYGLKGLLQIPEVMPAVTTFEATRLADEWLATHDTSEQAALLDSALARMADRAPGVVSAMWTTLLRVRDGHLGGVIEMEFEADMVVGLEDGLRLLELLRVFAEGPYGFSSHYLNVGEWRELKNHVEKWAHFTRPEVHEMLRAREAEILQETFPRLSRDEQAEVLPLLSPREWEEAKPGTEFLHVSEVLRVSAEESAIEMVLSRFAAPDGLDAGWGAGKDSVVRTILLDPDSPLYSTRTHLQRLHGIAGRAGDDRGIQRNFLTFFRQLAYGATEGGSFSVRDCRRLLANAELVQLLWVAAVVRPLNPRVAGSLRRYREFVGTLGSADHMPLPRWWERLEVSGFFEPRQPERTHEDEEDTSDHPQ